MTQLFDYDLFVVGGGSGGVRAARMAAQRGARVALAEARGVDGLGGTCVNLGCIPKKLYSYAAHYALSFEESHGFGWVGEAPKLNWEVLKTNRRQEISRLNGVYMNMLTGTDVKFINGWARLVDAHTVQVDGEMYSARNILISTGGQPYIPDIEGRELVLTSNDMFDLDALPNRLVVVGGGYIACEFASIFNGLGSSVIQCYRGEQVLRGFDDEVRHFVATEMTKSGVDLRLKTQVSSILRTSQGLAVKLENGELVYADAVLYATGRVPNVHGLALDLLEITQGRDGAIAINEHYQTNVPSIYALGDVTSRIQLTPVALAESTALIDRLFGPQPNRKIRVVDYEFIPTAVFTQPNIGTVGYTEADARKKFGAVDIYRSEFRALKHTLSGSKERTFMKLIVEGATDRVVGLHMVGPDAGEIVQGFAVALRAGATKAVFDSTIGIHPTVAEEFVSMRDPVSSH